MGDDSADDGKDLEPFPSWLPLPHPSEGEAMRRPADERSLVAGNDVLYWTVFTTASS
jgi:hypothetical protein